MGACASAKVAKLSVVAPADSALQLQCLNG